MGNLGRIDYLDYVRGGAIFLVLAHHSGILGPYILAFHMPLFFVLSGYILNVKGRKDERFVIHFKKRFNRLIIPYLLFEALILLSSIILHYGFKALQLEDVYHIEIGYAVRDILLCLESPRYIGAINLLWFFPCLFVADLLFFFVKRLINRLFKEGEVHAFPYFIIFVALALLSYLENKFVHIRLPFTLDTSLMATSFIALGYASRKLVDKIYNQTKSFQLGYVIFGLVGVIFSVKMNTGLFLMFVNDYGNYFYAMLGAVSGVLFFFSLIFLLEKILPKSGLVYLSINSLIFFPIHLLILTFMNKIFTYLNISVNEWSLPYIRVILTVLFMIPCIYIIN
ncbi:acyltransferase family protein, partial [Zobellia roscoffensis]